MKPYYEDEAVQIFTGDCREVLSVAPLMARPDLLLTDPPYASGARRDAERQVRGAMLRETDDSDWFSHDAMTTFGFQWFLRGLLVDLRRILSVGSHLYVFTDWRQQPNVYGMLESAGYRVNQSLVWDKEHFGMGAYWRNQHEHIVFGSLGMPTPMLDRGMVSVLRCRAVLPERRVHETEKPLELMLKILAGVPSECVLDPFCGSGPTLVAAKALGRKSIGIDIDERNCEIAANRVRQEVFRRAVQPDQNNFTFQEA